MSSIASDGQALALAELRHVARRSDGMVLIDGCPGQGRHGTLVQRIFLLTTRLTDQAPTPIRHRVAEFEPVDVVIPQGYPFERPRAEAPDDRFSGLPHVQWGRQLCLYPSDSDWNPSTGMSGFMRYLLQFYTRIILGNPDDPGEPWHPPVANTSASRETLVVRKDLEILADDDASGSSGSFPAWAIGWERGSRTDILGWIPRGANTPPFLDPATDTDAAAVEQLRAYLAALSGELGNVVRLVPCIVLSHVPGFEYPEDIGALLAALNELGQPPASVLSQLITSALANRAQEGGLEPPLLLLRAPAAPRFGMADPQQFFAGWRLEPDEASVWTALSQIDLDRETFSRFAEALMDSPVRWCQVHDARPEAVTRRDTGRPVERLNGARILIMGCGALGAPIAEHCARAGSASIHLVDADVVTPGILVRQPYTDDDIGIAKSAALAFRLRHVRPDLDVCFEYENVFKTGVFSPNALANYDLVIDATANRTVAVRMEQFRWQELQNGREQPELITLGVSQTSTHGIATVSPRNVHGASVDVYRHLSLALKCSDDLSDVAAAFFPNPWDQIRFQPDGCSSPTFIGSAADLAVLAGQLLDASLERLGAQGIQIDSPRNCEIASRRRTAHIIRLGRSASSLPARSEFAVAEDRTITSGLQHGATTAEGERYQIRISHPAMIQLRHVIESAAEPTWEQQSETGGILLGGVDEACGIVWVDQFMAPPTGSFGTPACFSLDLSDVRDDLRRRRSESGGLLRPIGFWHTHPRGDTTPSPTDSESMDLLLRNEHWALRHALLLVVGPDREGSQLNGIWDPAIDARFGTVQSRTRQGEKAT